MAFEKACVLFNVGALHTQLGSRHDRSSAAGLDAAVNCFLRAAGIFRFLHETFTNAPSKDLSPEVLDMLIQLMLAQARECLHEKTLISRKESIEGALELAQDASQVSNEYTKVNALITEASVKDYVPLSWVSLIRIKAEHYRGKSHYYVAEALLPATLAADKKEDLGLSHRAREILMYLHTPTNSNTTIKITLPTNRKERTSLGLSHGCESAQAHEEALRLLRMCRELRKKSGLSELLAVAHDDILRLLEEFQDYDEFLTVLDPPPVARKFS